MLSDNQCAELACLQLQLSRDSIGRLNRLARRTGLLFVLSAGSRLSRGQRKRRSVQPGIELCTVFDQSIP